MNFLRVKTTECRVGVVGLYNAGKTVFLTSLLNHLEHHDPDRFRLGKHASVRKFEIGSPGDGWVSFNYPGFRDALVHNGRWPEKTRDRSQALCQFERSDWTFSDVLLKLYDLPGERLADTAMIGRTYVEWSDHMLSLIENDTPYRTSCAPFFEAIAKPVPDERDVLYNYKLSLANLILSFKPMVSPSTFLLDTAGKQPRPDTPDTLAATRFAGMDPQTEFAPLPPIARTANPALTAAFATRFAAYRDVLVVPFLQALRSCHSLVVLVDVTTLLSAGVGMYDDNRQILRDLFQVLDPGENVAEMIGRHLAKLFLPHTLRPGGITRIAFVAPKIDLVQPKDRDKLLGLLKRMVGQLAQNCDGLQAEFFNCAAVASTKPLTGADGESYLVGIPYRDSTGKRIPPGVEQRFTVSAVPDDWPLYWKAGEYVFPEVYPKMPPRKDCPPEQVGLDRVLDFVLD